MEMMAAIEQGDLALASELQNRIWVDGPFRQPEQVNPLVRQRAAEMNRIALTNGTWDKADARPLRPLDPPAAQRLNEIHVPTLIVAGALDHPEILRAAEVLTTAIPGARKMVIPDCAHMPNMEKPAEFNRAVLDFLHGLA
jgi:pimeloyl-ACP methyl ester carboxylesterase